MQRVVTMSYLLGLKKLRNLGKNCDIKGKPCPELGMNPCFGAVSGSMKPHRKGWAAAPPRTPPR